MLPRGVPWVVKISSSTRYQVKVLLSQAVAVSDEDFPLIIDQVCYNKL